METIDTTWPAERETLIELRSQGLTYSQIGARFGVTGRAVEHRCRHLNITGFVNLQDRIRDLHAKGYSDEAMAADLTVGKSTVCRWRLALGLPPNGTSARSTLDGVSRAWPPSYADLERLIKTAHVSLSAIAEHYQVHRATLTAHAVSLGLWSEGTDPLMKRREENKSLRAAQAEKPAGKRNCLCCGKGFAPATRWIFVCGTCKGGELYRVSF